MSLDVRAIARVRPALKPCASVSARVVDPSDAGTSHGTAAVSREHAHGDGTEVEMTVLEKNKMKRGARRGDPPTVTTYLSRQRFTFDAAYGPTSDTLRLYAEAVEPLVHDVLACDGTTACVLAYGQTGSGKTHTISGDEGGSTPGLVHAVAITLLDAVAEHNARIREEAQQLCVWVTAGEVYQDQLLDLGVSLSSGGGSGSIGGGGRARAAAADKPRRLTPALLRRMQVRTPEELMATLEACIARRAQGATNKNDVSSRSHACYLISLERCGAPRQPVGLLALADLAGAEFAAATEGLDAARRREGALNNLGLMTLKAAFKHLGTQQQQAQQQAQQQQGHGLATTAATAATAALPPFAWHRSTLTRILKPFMEMSAPIQQAQQDDVAEDDEGEDGGAAAAAAPTVALSGRKKLVLLVTVSPEPADDYQSALALTDALALLGRTGSDKIVTELIPHSTTSSSSTGATTGAASGAGPVKAFLKRGQGVSGGRQGAVTSSTGGAGGGRAHGHLTTPSRPGTL